VIKVTYTFLVKRKNFIIKIRYSLSHRSAAALRFEDETTMQRWRGGVGIRPLRLKPPYDKRCARTRLTTTTTTQMTADVGNEAKRHRRIWKINKNTEHMIFFMSIATPSSIRSCTVKTDDATGPATIYKADRLATGPTAAAQWLLCKPVDPVRADIIKIITHHSYYRRPWTEICRNANVIQPQRTHKIITVVQICRNKSYIV